MKKTLISLLIAFSLAFGGYNAQAAQAQVPELLKRANDLVYKMVKLGEEGQPVPQELAYLYAEKMAKAYGQAAEMEKTAQAKAMKQIRKALKTQTRTMTMLRENIPEGKDPLMTQLFLMVNAQNRLVQKGETEPLKYAAAIRQVLQAGMPEGITAAGSPNDDPAKGASKATGKGSAKGGK